MHLPGANCRRHGASSPRTSSAAHQRARHAKAHTAADTALRLSPELAAAHLALSGVLAAAFDWRGSEAEIRRAVALAPDEGDPKFALGTLLATFGDLEQAMG